VLVFGTQEGDLHLVDCKTCEVIRSLPGLFKTPVTALTFLKNVSDKKSLLVMAYSSDNSVAIVDIKKSEIKQTFKAVGKKDKQATEVHLVEVSSDFKHAVEAFGSGVRLRNLADN
jgi:hypothetical protein